MFDDIMTPTLLLDEARCRANIRRMVEKCRRLGLRLRPHLKTAQSHVVARWFRELGVDAITASSFRMAGYFAEDGWRDITVAFPVNIREMERINRLAGKVKLHLVAENVESVRALKAGLQHPVQVWIKTDIGNNRTGLLPENSEQIDAVLDEIGQGGKLRFAGFLGHAGQSYQARGKAAITEVHQRSLAVMHALRLRYQERWPGLQVSVGDTPTASVVQGFSGVDEIRPGNFVFYDLMQWQIGSCTPGEIAVAMACPVVAKHPGRNEAILYGGAVHFSKDHLVFPDGAPYYGLAADWKGGGWELLQPKAYLRALSQEHGILRCEPSLLKQLEVGSLVLVLPVHSCLTADLMKRYRTLDGEWIGMMGGSGIPGAWED
ncbi:MAG: alanine racemase [Lewinellaceae bacterium]|nr:alanine racemase [Lewinellaceae bacterium]